ncbi:MAG TPA: PglZ domain-containing protein [Acidimicrobiales bacterium]|nr:PglZ domain-containing protein [Acidimicrobiales bacterium]
MTSDATVDRAEDLPFDIEQASVVCRVRIPGEPATDAALLELEPEISDRAVNRLGPSKLSATDAVLTAAADLPPLCIGRAPADQLRLALRLAGKTLPASLLAIASAQLDDPVAVGAVEDPPSFDDLQQAWESWVGDAASSPWTEAFVACRAELIDLFLGGGLVPVRGDPAGVPPWAVIGVRAESSAERVDSLLGAPPADASKFEDWVRTAQWWGEVRSNLAQVNPRNDDLSTRAWSVWAELDERFQAWLRSEYGSQLSRTWISGPVSLDKVQPFLATRRSASERILLIVLDGLGFAQWSLIRDRARLRVVRAGGVLAMLPTLTEVSRQAIAAAMRPTEFADSLRSTSKEPRHWSTAWADAVPGAIWKRIDGARLEELDSIPLATSTVVGVVLSITDELMHSAEQLGDLGLHAGIDTWIRSEVLDTLVTRATALGFETWITADHGNLECIPTAEPREGAFVERAGTRARRYGSKSLRDEGAAVGLRWDQLPGYPTDESERLLFAPGRTGWGPSRVSHGGLSLDEVIVPFVQVEAP